jgi:hypothetical protein
MSIRKVKMATSILMLFNAPEREHSNGVFKKQQCLHSQKLCTEVGQKYHPESFFLTRPARPITCVRICKIICLVLLSDTFNHKMTAQKGLAIWHGNGFV